MTEKTGRTITIAVNPEERAELEAAAAAAEMKITPWIRKVALAAARGQIHPALDEAYTHLVQALAAVEPDASTRVREELAQLRKVDPLWTNPS